MSLRSNSIEGQLQMYLKSEKVQAPNCILSSEIKQKKELLSLKGKLFKDWERQVADFLQVSTTITISTKSRLILCSQLIWAKNKASLLPDLRDEPHSLYHQRTHIQLHMLETAPGCRMGEESHTRQKLSLLQTDFQLHLIQLLFYGSLPYPRIPLPPPLAPQHGSRIYILQVNWGIKNADPIKPLGS